MIDLVIVMDPVEGLSKKKDSTLAMCLAAQARGWTVYSVTQDGLYFAEGQVLALATPLTVNLSADPFWHLGETVTRPLASFSGVLMRKDPPFDMEYIYITYLLERAETAGVPVFNRPASLRDCNEKFFATAFPKFTPPLIVSKRAEQLRAFAEAEGDVVMKPLDGMGGA
ncbi:MAG: glutathione synthase, partial [Pseudomonadota bacterium]|nr:glutathione synthase [Pseudomonadota bacterium]